MHNKANVFSFGELSKAAQSEVIENHLDDIKSYIISEIRTEYESYLDNLSRILHIDKVKFQQTDDNKFYYTWSASPIELREMLSTHKIKDFLDKGCRNIHVIVTQYKIPKSVKNVIISEYKSNISRAEHSVNKILETFFMEWEKEINEKINDEQVIFDTCDTYYNDRYYFEDGLDCPDILR